MKCANDCGQEIRETEPRDGIEMHDGEPEFRWVHEDGNPFCDGMFVATPGGDGYGPASATGPDPVLRSVHDFPAGLLSDVLERKAPAFITDHGRFVAMIVPLEPGQVESRALAAMAREIAEGLAP